ncbi:MAG: hypothetical protein VX112_05745 [Pseudomonadota bacterium]|nr:hypothetical protein [Pseudomonadota bacterium]
MPTWNLDCYKNRLLQVLTYYENKIVKSGLKLNQQRRKDITYLRDCIQLITDDVLLDRELKEYLSRLKTTPTWYTLFLSQREDSELRAMLETVMVDEQVKYIQQYQEQKSEVMQEIIQINQRIMRKCYQNSQNQEERENTATLLIQN